MSNFLCFTDRDNWLAVLAGPISGFEDQLDLLEQAIDRDEITLEEALSILRG